MGISIGVDFLPNQIKLHELVLFCLDLHAHMMEAVVLEIILKKNMNKYNIYQPYKEGYFLSH